VTLSGFGQGSQKCHGETGKQKAEKLKGEMKKGRRVLYEVSQKCHSVTAGLRWRDSGSGAQPARQAGMFHIRRAPSTGLKLF
jgi:hypothetical protein